MANSPSKPRNDNVVIEFPARDHQRRELMTSQQLRGHKVLLKNKKFVKRNRLKTQENTQKRVKNKLSSHLMENINEGPI